jgi:hypothetical protein
MNFRNLGSVTSKIDFEVLDWDFDFEKNGKKYIFKLKAKVAVIEK